MSTADSNKERALEVLAAKTHEALKLINEAGLEVSDEVAPDYLEMIVSHGGQLATYTFDPNQPLLVSFVPRTWR